MSSDEKPIIRSKRLIEELFVFIWNGSRAEAQSGYNDDLVMSYSIGLWMRDTAIMILMRGKDLQKKSLEYLGNRPSPIITSSYSKDPYIKTYGSFNNKQVMDLRWLLDNPNKNK
jgi:hypothetical protein